MDTLTAIATRRSTRVYKPEQISDSQLPNSFSRRLGFSCWSWSI